jgi:pyrroloquinoline quinone biosynthesis protein E
MTAPIALIAELTHRCPLQCVYCSNPIALESTANELPTEVWTEVFRQASEIGIMQLHLTGGEPLARTDLLQLIQSAHASGLYTNLITSGIGLTAERLDRFIQAGLDHLQLSLQGATQDIADSIAGVTAHARKLTIAKEISKRKIAFTVNAVIHKANCDELPSIISLAEQMGAHKLEIAHVQYYGWALVNREFLLPTREQLDGSVETVRLARERLVGKMRIEFVVPDYYAKFPKACMGGWGRSTILITPTGEAWPCHAAGVLPGLSFENVREHSLKSIWEESVGFTRFRGEQWMTEPCKSCDRRTLDFAGCRCQAWLIAQDSSATDPVCSLSAQHHLVTQVLTETVALELIPMNSKTKHLWTYRENPRT